MPKIRIYQNDILQVDDVVSLNKRNSHYLKKVLRIKQDEKIIMFNGDGYNYLAKILDATHNNIQILAKLANDVESSIHITLVQAIGKGEKMDIVVQKAVELGVKKIIPIITQRTIYKSSNKDERKIMRWQEMAINSCEQCGRSVVPKIENITIFNELSLDGTTFMLDTSTHQTLKTYLKPETTINIVIGPEGGFTNEELDIGITNNYHKLSLGKRILRTETAAIATLAGMFTLWE